MATVSPQPLIGGEPLSSPVVGGALLSLLFPAVLLPHFRWPAGRPDELSQWVERALREPRHQDVSPALPGTEGEHGPGRGAALCQGGEREGGRR